MSNEIIRGSVNEKTKQNFIGVTLHPIGQKTLEPISFDIGETPLLAGRTASSTSSVNLINLSSLVTSRKHALLWFKNGHVYIKDNGSSTGTYVNGQKIAKEDENGHRLNNQDIIRFGEDLEINGVMHNSEVFRIEFSSKKNVGAIDMEEKVRELYTVTKSSYEKIWCNIVNGIYTNLEKDFCSTESASAIKNIISKIQNP